MGNLINISLNNRFISPNEITKNIIENNLDVKNKLEEAASYHKNNLLSTYKNEDTDIPKYLKALAKESFGKECELYEKIDEDFSKSIKQAYDNTSQYLTKNYEQNLTFGEALTNLFYNGNSKKDDKNLTILLTDLGHLDAHQLIKMTEVSNDKIVANIIVSNTDQFFKELKIEKNISAKLGKEAAETFSVLLNENNIMDYVTKNEIKDSEIKKIVKEQLIQLQKSDDFLKMDRSSRQKKMLEIITQAGGQISDFYDFLVELYTDQIWTQIAPYVKKGIGKKTIKKALIDFIKTGKQKNETNQGFSLTRAGAQIKKDGISVYTLASYDFDIPKIIETFTPFLIEKEIKDIKTMDIKTIENSNIFDQAMLSALQGYNDALQKYLTSIGHNDAWNYYANHFLNKVISLAKRDFQDEKNNDEAISNISSEIKKGVDALQIAHSLDEIIEEIDYLKQLSNQNVSSSEINKIIDKSLGYLNKDEKDRETLTTIKKLINNNSKEEAIKILRNRLNSKRAGYISNFNGSIGEIFITAILAVVFGGKIPDIYQKGSSKNLIGQSAHADITMGNIGIQSKVYEKNDIKLYDNTEVKFKLNEALRYLRTKPSNSKKVEENDELSSFRFFLLNNTILQELGSNQSVDDNFFLRALNLRLENFIRYSDGLTRLGSIKNNFYLINFNIVPASVIFLKMAEIFENNNLNIMIDFNNQIDITELKMYQDDDEKNYLLNNLNVLKLLHNSSAKFKSFTLNLKDLGLEKFK